MIKLINKLIILKKFQEAGFFFGFDIKNWPLKSITYLLSKKKNNYIIDLNLMFELLRIAGNFIKFQYKLKKKILFIGTKKNISSYIRLQSIKCKSYYINFKWLPGMLTNWKIIKKQISKFKKYNNINNKKAHKKKKLIKVFFGFKNLKKMPNLIILLNCLKNPLILKESVQFNIPTICIVDINSNLENITLPIPANIKSIFISYFVLNFFSNKINYNNF
jgi:small subunit ribosomal protein S2